MKVENKTFSFALMSLWVRVVHGSGIVYYCDLVVSHSSGLAGSVCFGGFCLSRYLFRIEIEV